MNVHGAARSLQLDVRAVGQRRGLRGVAQDGAFDRSLLRCVIRKAPHRGCPRPVTQFLRPNRSARTSRSANRTTEILTGVVFCISHSGLDSTARALPFRSLWRASGLQVTPDCKNPFVPEKLHRFFGPCAALPFSRWLRPHKMLPGKRGHVLYVERGRTPYRGDGTCQEACEKVRWKKASEPGPQEFQKKIRFARVASLI